MNNKVQISNIQQVEEQAPSTTNTPYNLKKV